MKKIKKIYILGTAGCGKTTLAKFLSKKLNIPNYDLDDIKWKKKYTLKRTKEEKRKLLEKITKKRKWITEGPYTSFIEPAIKNSDLIIWLQLNKNITSYRILKRYFKKEKEIKDSFLYTIKLAKIIRNYKKEKPHFESHKESLKNYKNKTIIIKNKKEIETLIQKILSKNL